MSVKLSVDQQLKRVKTELEGEITYRDLTRYLRRKKSAGALFFDELTDLRNAVLSLSGDEVRLLAGYLLQLSATEKLGRTAFVAADPASFGLIRMLALLTDDFYELEVFRDKREAEKWLNWSD